MAGGTAPPGAPSYVVGAGLRIYEAATGKLIVVLGSDSFGSRRLAVDVKGDLVTSDRTGDVMVWRAFAAGEAAKMGAAGKQGKAQ